MPYQALGIWLCRPIGWAAATAISIVFYTTGVWKKGFIMRDLSKYGLKEFLS